MTLKLGTPEQIEQVLGIGGGAWVLICDHPVHGTFRALLTSRSKIPYLQGKHRYTFFAMLGGVPSYVDLLGLDTPRVRFLKFTGPATINTAKTKHQDYYR